MPRRKTADTEPVKHEARAAELQDQRDDLAELMESLGAEAVYVRLYRRAGGVKSYLGQVGLDVDLEWIRTTHGGGEYIAQGCTAQGRTLGTRTFRIEGPPRLAPAAESSPAAGQLVGYRPAASEAPGSLYDMARRMDDILHELRRPPAVAQQGNPLEMAGSIVASILTAATPLVELMKDKRPPRGEGGGSDRLMDAFTRGMKIGVGLGRNGQAGTWQDRLVEAVIPAINGQQSGAGVPAGESAEVAPMLPANVNPESWRAAVAPYVPRLNALAAEGRDPQLYADLIVDQAPPAILDELVRQIGRGPAFLEEFFRDFPSAGHYREWWNELLVRVRFVATMPAEDSAGGADDGGAAVDLSRRAEVATG